MSQSQEKFRTEGRKDGKTGRKDRRTDGRTLIHRTLLTTAGGQKKKKKEKEKEKRGGGVACRIKKLFI